MPARGAGGSGARATNHLQHGAGRGMGGGEPEQARILRTCDGGGGRCQGTCGERYGEAGAAGWGAHHRETSELRRRRRGGAHRVADVGRNAQLAVRLGGVRRIQH